MASRLALEQGTDILLLETGDGLLLEIREYVLTVSTALGLAPSALRAFGLTVSLTLGLAPTVSRAIVTARSVSTTIGLYTVGVASEWINRLLRAVGVNRDVENW